MSSDPAQEPTPPSWATNNGPERGKDGGTDGNWAFGPGDTTVASNSIFHTDLGVGEWWEVDLGASKTIDRIELYNRTDNGLAIRAQNITLTINGGSAVVIPGTTGLWTHVTYVLPTPIIGQVVRVTNGGGSNYFHLAEVEVWGH
jgi:hypothetical protein